MTGHGEIERKAFEALYLETRTDLLGYLVRRCCNPDEAADLLAETYLIAWQKLTKVPEGHQARLWLFGVARNLLRRKARRNRVADALVERLSFSLERISVDIPNDDPTYNALHSALADLSERDREILTLAAWEDLTPAEISTVIGISANAVRIRLHRTRRRLAKRLSTIAPMAATPAIALRPEP